MTPIMKCGHAANGRDMQTGRPVCVICVGIDPGAEEVSETQPDLTGRVARCVYCKTEAPASSDLAFFDAVRLEYYCGCRGWD